MTDLIEKRINFTKVTFDTYRPERGYQTQHFIVFRKLSGQAAKKLCRQRDDSFIPASVKIEHFTRVYHISIPAFIDAAACVKTIQTDQG